MHREHVSDLYLYVTKIAFVFLQIFVFPLVILIVEISYSMQKNMRKYKNQNISCNFDMDTRNILEICFSHNMYHIVPSFLLRIEFILQMLKPFSFEVAPESLYDLAISCESSQSLS
jgi:hypothetical protein